MGQPTITARIVLSFLVVSILPLTVVGFALLSSLDRASDLTVADSTEALRRLGEASIRQQAVDVARQVEIYLRDHPDATMASLEVNEYFKGIAWQQVGQTGYTALYDAGTGILHVHPNPELVGRSLSFLAERLPSFWAVFEPSLAGREVAGYYDWLEPDGSIRQKYMVMTPVREPFQGITLMLAATTYIDEFAQPVRAVEFQMTSISEETRRELVVMIAVASLLAIGLATEMGRWLGRPLRHLTTAAEELEQDEFRPESLAAEAARRDDLGHLARVFIRMAQQVQAREDHLKRQVEQLRIEIDLAKKDREVAEISGSEYFQQLQRKAREFRNKSESARGDRHPTRGTARPTET